MSSGYDYITEADQLEKLCVELMQCDWFALDTEFMREKNYFPKLCLIQVATPTLTACIDPLQLKDLEPFLGVLYNSDIIKVLHAARQDFELFYHLRGALPGPVFDTQLAATLLGLGDQVGYATLVQQLLGKSLHKTHTRTDWSARPLDIGQLEYAADDVYYLAKLYPVLLAQLEEHGRLDWLKDDFDALLDIEQYAIPAATLWQRISGRNRLKGNQLAVLQALAAWREETAREKDRPRKWILADDVLLNLARLQPTNTAALKKVRGLNQQLQQEYGGIILAMIDTARSLPSELWPQAEQVVRLSKEQEAISDFLGAYVKLCAAQNKISANTLAPRRQIEQLIRGEQQLEILHGWRADMVGSNLLRLMNGEFGLAVNDNTLVTCKC